MSLHYPGELYELLSKGESDECYVVGSDLINCLSGISPQKEDSIKNMVKKVLGRNDTCQCEVSKDQFNDIIAMDGILREVIVGWIVPFEIFCDQKTKNISIRDAEVILHCLGSANNNHTDYHLADGSDLTFLDFIQLASGIKTQNTMKELTELIKIFNHLSGSDNTIAGIEKNELSILLTCLGSTFTPDELNQIMSVLDTSSSGRLLLEDFLRMISTSPEKLNIKSLLDVVAAFRLFDKRGDGTVTFKELTNVSRALGQKISPDQIKELIPNTVEGVDKVVEFSEFLIIMSKVLTFRDEDEKATKQSYELSLCGECQSVPATVDCTECHESYCTDCCTVVHSKGRRKRHFNFINVKVCGECDTIAACWECATCNEFYCDGCNKNVHSRGRRRSHTDIQEIVVERHRVIEYDTNNGFGIHVTHDLSISRFGRAQSMELQIEDLPPYMHESYSLMIDCAAICAECEIPQYIDTEYTNLQLNDQTDLPLIGIGMNNEHHNKALHEKHEREKVRLRDTDYQTAVSKLFMWKRPSQIWKTSFLFTKGNTILGDWPTSSPKPSWLVPYLVKFYPAVYDLSWLLLPIAVVATRLELFKWLFVSSDFSHCGIYAFQFFHTEDTSCPIDEQSDIGWRCVCVDSLIPMQLGPNKGLVPTIGRTDDESALWLVYLLKAYAKFRGSYSYLHGGSVNRAFKELTSGEPRTERWSCKRICDTEIAVLWWKILIASRLGLMTCCFHIDNNIESSTVEVLDSEQADNLNWREGEQIILACDITAASTAELTGHRSRLSGGLKLMKLRNLYGKSTVPGQWDWNPESNKWNSKRMRKAMNYTRVDECIQWIEVRDFATHYNTITMVLNPPGSPFVAIRTLEPCMRGKTACHAHQYHITISQIASEEGGLLADALTNEVIDTETLYDAPDFRNLPESSDDNEEDDYKSRLGVGVARSVKTVMTVGSASGLHDKKGYTIKMFLSQPNTSSLSDAAVLGKGMKFHAFRLPGKGLQNVDEITDDEDNETYSWPTYNELELVSIPLNEPTSNPDKLRDLTLLETLKSFNVTHAGHYAIVIEQEHHVDTVDYCLAITGKEDSLSELTGLKLHCEYVGSYMDPLCRTEKVGGCDRTSQSMSFYKGED